MSVTAWASAPAVSSHGCPVTPPLVSKETKHLTKEIHGRTRAREMIETFRAQIAKMSSGLGAGFRIEAYTNTLEVGMVRIEVVKLTQSCFYICGGGALMWDPDVKAWLYSHGLKCSDVKQNME